jgi:hypothetical protein
MRATAGAISVFLMSALGFGLGPVFVGVLSDFLAPELGLEALRYALVAPVCLLPLMSFVLYAAAKSVRESHTRSSPRIQARMVELVDE